MTEFTSSGSTWDDDRADQFVNLDVNRNGRVERVLSRQELNASGGPPTAVR